MSILIAQSLYQHNEFYIFRPLGNDSYKEVKFQIEKGEIREDTFNKLKYHERMYILDTIL